MSMNILPPHRRFIRPSIPTALCAAVALVAIAMAGGLSSGDAIGQAQPVRRVVGPAETAVPVVGHPRGQVNNPKTGQVYTGLRRSAKCPHGFLVPGSQATSRCAHGPDPAPPGVDVRKRPPLTALTTAAASELTAGGDVSCYGTGSDGQRIQAIYAVAADRADRYSSLLSLLPAYAANADKAFNDSAALGGQQRHLRWVTDGACKLVVEHVVLSATGDDTFGTMKAELSNLGYNRTDRKYMVWVDGAVYCGIANLQVDDRPGQDNANNHGPTFARVDSGCWGAGASVEAHEIAHMLGGVQLSAPHSNGAGHCTDEYDRMCYNDGSAAPLQFVCASSMEPLLDCHGDDYFNVSPPTGSYLDTHWNLADSAYLEKTGSSVPVPSPSPTVSSTPTQSPSPSPTPTSTNSPTATSSPSPTASTSPTPAPTAATTSVFSGSLNKKVRSRTYNLQTGTGTLRGNLKFTRANSLTFTLKDAQGLLMTTVSGPSVVAVLSAVPSGVYSVTVSGSTGSSFTLTVTYPTA
jgi:hypothetical protein